MKGLYSTVYGAYAISHLSSLVETVDNLLSRRRTAIACRIGPTSHLKLSFLSGIQQNPYLLTNTIDCGSLERELSRYAPRNVRCDKPPPVPI